MPSEHPEEPSTQAGSGAGVRQLFLLIASIVALSAGSVILVFYPWQPLPTERVQDAEVIRIAGLRAGEVPTGEDLERAAELLRLHPAVRDAKVERTGAASLRITVSERECVALVRGEEDVLYEVDAELSILSENRVRCGNVPLIRGSFQRETNRFVDERLKKLTEDLARMAGGYPALSSRLSEVHWRQAGELTLFFSPPRVRVELKAGLDGEALRRLDAAFSYYEREGCKDGVIDLRGPDAIILPSCP